MTTKIYIVTPSLNSRATIDRTILSVVTQAGDFFIRYHIQDGGSADGTVERLQWWQRRLASREFPFQCHGVEFSFVSHSDAGMYDAICAGFGTLRIRNDEFMTWINADDILTQGSCSLIADIERQFSSNNLSWICGASAIMRGDRPIVSFDNPITKAALRSGICDGTHWNFLQQEGTFFRKWLWSSVSPNETIKPMKLAGDWNLWRLFAERATLVQTKQTLGRFRIVEGQLSARQRDRYMAEIDSIIPPATRRQSLADLGKGQPVVKRTLRVRYADAQLSIIDENCSGIWEHNHTKVFGEPPRQMTKAPEEHIVAIGSPYTAVKLERIEDIILKTGNIFAYDRDWQFPAITEQHAYQQLRDFGSVPENVTYVAYPWATLIDKLQTQARDAYLYLKLFREYCEKLPAGSRRVTVCQHVLMKQYIYLFEEAGITDIFWTHTTHGDLADDRKEQVNLLPFPLYPVQITSAEDHNAKEERPFLFSFIGAKSNQYYLTNARDLIIDQLASHPKGLIIGRDAWHYNKVVYGHQVHMNADKFENKLEELVDKSASEQFRESLAKSLFSLCPSGSGPNSIRLWESLGSGSIPVILSETYAPPGNPRLWSQAVIFCEESEEAIKQLPDRLEEIAKNPERIRTMRHAMHQLWLLYGPHGFTYDIQSLMMNLADKPDAEVGTKQSDYESFTQSFARSMPIDSAMSIIKAVNLLRICSSELLIEGTERLGRLRDDTSLGQLLALAQERVGPDNSVGIHFRRVVDHLSKNPHRALSNPMVGRSERLKICLYGRHSNRTPLAYEPFQKLAISRIQIVTNPMEADIVMTGFNRDIRENVDMFEELTTTRPDTKVVIISEEPLWDSIWSGGFIERYRSVQCGKTELSYTFLNHSNSSIFDFIEIPYFLLTREDYLLRYSLLLARYKNISPANLFLYWRKAPIPAAFFAEFRDQEVYNKALEESNIYGLSVYRTEVAKNVDHPGVLRIGKGWQSYSHRQNLPDWHLDKLVYLHGRVRIVSAFENTHQRNYVSEKIFDAFVVGGIPVYYSDESHKVRSLVSDESMINTFGLTSSEAAKRISEFEPDMSMAEAWLDTASRLQNRFSDVSLIAKERRRIVDAVLSELL